ncbi:MAG: hypothetical protein AAGA54_37470 [Myxococcota bacterium]
MAWMEIAVLVAGGALANGQLTQPELAEDTSADVGSTDDATLGTDDAATESDAEADLGAGEASDTFVPAPTASMGMSSDDEVAESAESRTDNSALYDTSSAPAEASSGGIDGFDGRFGVGAIRTIAGINGINARYFLTDQLALGASAGVALFTYKENDPESTDPGCPEDGCELENTRTIAALGFNIEALYFLHLGREAGQLPFRADFGLGGRFGVITSANAADIADNLDDPTELHIEIPLVFQLMFGNNFALSPELGVDFRITPGSREEGDVNPGASSELVGLGAVDGPGFGFNITPGIGLFGGASMHYYF